MSNVHAHHTSERECHRSHFKLSAGVGMVGFYGVSGLPQVDDHRFIVETLRLVQ